MSFFKNLFQKDEEPQPSPAESPELAKGLEQSTVWYFWWN